MANPEKLFRDALIADAAAMAILVGGVHFFRAPDRVARPYAVLSLTSEVRDPPLKGVDCLPQALIEVQLIANLPAALGAARQAIRNAMDGYSGSGIAICRLENQITAYDQEAELPRAILDYRVIYEETD